MDGLTSIIVGTLFLFNAQNELAPYALKHNDLQFETFEECFADYEKYPGWEPQLPVYQDRLYSEGRIQKFITPIGGAFVSCQRKEID